MANYPRWDWAGESLLTANPAGDPAQQVAIALGRDKIGILGYLEVFYIGTDGMLHHVRQMSPGNSNSWVELPTLGVATQVVVGQNGPGDNRLEVFYTGPDSQILRNRQVTAGGTDWEGESAPFGDDKAVQMAVCRDALDRLELVYVGTNGQLYHNRQYSGGSEAWVGETPFHQAGKQVQIIRNPNYNNYLEVYWIGSGNGLHRLRQNSLGDINNWTDYPFASDFARQISVGANADGRLEIFYVGTNNDLYHNWLTSTVDQDSWYGETRFPGSSAINVTAVSNADGRLEIFYVGQNWGLYHNWQASPNGDWIGEVRFTHNWAEQIVGALNIDDRLEICYIGTNTVLYHNSQLHRNGSWTDTNAAGGQTPYDGNPGSDNNYFLTNFNNLTDVSVTIQVYEDINCDKSAPITSDGTPLVYDSSLRGYAFQLNCYSPLHKSTSWQQYIMLVDTTGTSIQGVINFFTGSAIGIPILNIPSVPLCNVGSGITSGYQLQINLLNDDNAIITGVNFRVIDNHGAEVANQTMILTDHGFTADQQSPIVAMTLNFVGQVNSLYAHFTEGAGQIIYASSQLMTAEGMLPYFAQFRQGTAEASNSVYGAISPLGSNLLTQSFVVTVS